MSNVVAIPVGSSMVVDETQEQIKRLLVEWREQASKLWKTTAEIGVVLEAKYRTIGDESWATWIEGLGVPNFTQYTAYLFMRAAHYPELMERHKPEGLGRLVTILPQGLGTAFDSEMAAEARRLHADGAGMSKAKVAVHMHVSDNTVRRWLDPVGAAKAKERKAEAERNRRAAADAKRDRERMAALRAKGGVALLAVNGLQTLATQIQAEMEQTEDRERHKALRKLMDEIYRAKDQAFRVEAIR